jgi:hypothetical protein
MVVKSKGGRREAPPATPGTWATTLAPFLSRYAWLLSASLLLVASIRIVTTYDQLSLTFDEPAHLACGMEYVAHHVYRYESQHPPLSRAMIGLGAYLAGARPQGLPRFTPEGVQIVKASPDPDRTVRFMRAGILPFFWIAGITVFLWAKRYFGVAEAVLAVGLFTLLPPVLAHAGLATTDMSLTASLPAAVLATLIWAHSPGWRQTLLMGIAWAFAALTKFSALGYLPASIGLCLAAWLAFHWPGMRELQRLAAVRAAKFAAAAGIAAFTIWAAYWFSFGKVPGTGWTLPAPEFFDGIGVAFRHSTEGHPAYLLGEGRVLGWWYFFPVAIAVKTPIAFLLMAATGLAVCLRRTKSSAYLFPPAAAGGVLVPAMLSHVNIGVRHVLPLYPILCLIAALGLAAIARFAVTRTGVAATAGVLVAWMAVSGALSHSDHLAYFNEFASADPEAVLVDSDLDWGQDLKALSRRLHAAGARAVRTNFGDYFSSAPLYDLPPMQPIQVFTPSEGWNVVSPTAAKHTAMSVILTGTSFEDLVRAERSRTPWYDRMIPVERVGALKLYYFPPGAVPALP